MLADLLKEKLYCEGIHVHVRFYFPGLKITKNSPLKMVPYHNENNRKVSSFLGLTIISVYRVGRIDTI